MYVIMDVKKMNVGKSKVVFLLFLLGISAISLYSLMERSEQSSFSQREIPSFEGPYGEQMAEDYRASDSEYFHQVIADGVVSEEEFREGNEREAQCLRDRGFTTVIFNSDGSYSFDDRSDISDEEERRLADDCSQVTGNKFVSLWYRTLTANPDNADWSSAERDCLVKAGLLESGTSVEEMNYWYEQKGKGSDSYEAYVCSQDPLGKLGLK